MPQHNYPNGHPWSDSDIAFLQRNAGEKTLRDIAVALNRTHASVRSMSTRMSLNLRCNYTKWTKAELRVIRSYAGIMSAEQVAEKLGRTIHSVKGKAKHMGISLLCIGERHHLAIYSDHDVSLCIALHDEGLSTSVISEKMEIPASSVHEFIHGKRLTLEDTSWRNALRKKRGAP